MRMVGWTTLIYGLIVFLGGIFGYVKAESVASLVMGVIFATLLSVSTFLMFNEKKIGFYGGMATTAILFLFFLYRFLITYRVMPAGMMCLLSLAVLIVMLSKICCARSR